MVFGELGELPISENIKTRMLCFWSKLVSDNNNKISSMLYRLLYTMDRENMFSSNWIITVKNLLNNCGFTEYWTNQSFPNSLNWFKETVKQRINDQYVQTWNDNVFHSGKCTNYRMFKTRFAFENYLVTLPLKYRRSFTRFRCRNHKLPIETDAYKDIARRLRFCRLCGLNKRGDEFHYIFVCEYLKKERKEFITHNSNGLASSQTMCDLFNNNNSNKTIALCKFIDIIVKQFK